MTVEQVASVLQATECYFADAGREVTGGFAGDLLSYCMSKAKTDGVWFTIMNNTNVAAVASLCDVALVLLCDGIQPDAALIERCRANGINLAVTPLAVYEASVSLGKTL